MAITIGFLTSLGVNVGDEFIREGIRAILDQTGRSYHPFYVHKLESRSVFQAAGDEVEEIGDKYWDSDIFIQAGAPVYWHLLSGQSTSLTSDWHRWIWQERILNPSRKDHPLFLNLGAGSCQPWGDDGSSFLRHPECAQFAKSAGEAALATTVRDPLASSILKALSVDHIELPCPAFLSAARHQPRRPAGSYIGVNLMPLGGHFDLQGNFDRASWLADCLRLVSLIRSLGKIAFFAHDETELDFLQRFKVEGERIFHSHSWREYLDFYPQCSLVIANRVHGSVCAAGFGVPSLILGNDSRARIGEYLGLPVFQSGNCDLQEVGECASRLLREAPKESERFLHLRRQTMGKYADLLAPLLEKAQTEKAAPKRPGPRFRSRAALGSVQEIRQAGFSGWMECMNAFAGPLGLRTFLHWSKVWEYPWVWFNGLSALEWREKAVVDVGSELSPLPWFLAKLGAKVALVETDRQWIPRWEALREKLQVDVRWHIVDSEALPLPDRCADVVTSLSVLEHQGDPQRAIDEILRILKPGGTLAVSFDVCEPSRGMSFPEWNGRALTLEEFEDRVWRNPFFENPSPPRWNVEDIPAFLEWHLQSAEHHNYVVGAAILRKTQAPPPAPYFRFGRGWYAEEAQGSDRWRWSAKEGGIELCGDRDWEVEARFELFSLPLGNQVRVFLGGNEVWRYEVAREGFHPVEPLRVSLRPGRHLLQFVSQEEAILLPTDPRPLAFSVRNFTVKAAGR